MRNDRFWDYCEDNTIRKKVAEFIDNTPRISEFSGEEYYDLEDALTEFIERNRREIAREVDLEYYREDLLVQAEEDFGKIAEDVVKVLPIGAINDIIEAWQETLACDDSYWESNWNALRDALSDGGISPLAGIDKYPRNKVLIYAAYLKEWYTDTPAEMVGVNPACIDEFFNNEMADDELSSYYIKMAQKLFGGTPEKYQLNATRS